jgi:peptide/nickel transport system substrate-binding protein
MTATYLSPTPKPRLRRLAGPAAGLTATMLLFTACGTAARTSAPAQRAALTASTVSSTLTIAEDEPPASIDPIQADNSTVDEVDRPEYSALVQYPDGPNPKLQDDLASSYTVASNGLTYTFHLKSGVTFHNGAALTATDVKYTLDRIKQLDTGVASELQAYASSTVINPLTIQITLSTPYSPFLGALSRVYILNSALVTANAGSDFGQTWLGTHDAGSGPYELKQYVPSQSVTMTAYPGYFGGWKGDHANTVIFNYLPEAATQAADLNSGQANVAMEIDPSQYASYKKKKGYTLNVANTAVQLYVFLKTDSGPMQNILLRKAAAEAYDYKTHISQILDGYGTIAKGPLSTAIACHDPSVTQPTYNLAAAKKLVTQAHATGDTVSIAYLPALNEEKEGFELLQSALTQIGLKVKGVGTTFPAYENMLKSAATTPDMSFVYSFPEFPDPNEVLYINFDSKFIGTGYNYSRYTNTAVDQEVEAAQTTTNQTQRCSDYTKAQEQIAKDYVTINVSDPQYVTVLGPGVHGYEYNVAHHKTVDVYNTYVTK